MRRDGSVDAYAASLEGPRRAAIDELRRRCRRELRGFKEVLRYAMPAYERDGEIEIAFKAQSRYISLYVSRLDVMEQLRPQLGAVSAGKGCIRFPRTESIDWELVDRALRLTSATRGEVC